MTDTTREEFFTPKRTRGSGCMICGKPTTLAVMVMVRERLKQDRSGGPYGRSRSEQRSFCDEHGFLRFDEMFAVLRSP